MDRTNNKGIPHSSLSEVHETIDVRGIKGFWKKLFAFLGPAYLISVGYMDPGNWATDIAGGSQFGYSLIWVLLMSNLMALLLQNLSARLGIVRGLDLAQASRQTYAPAINFFLYILAEIAIAACDLAEVIGMAIGLQLLFGVPLLWGVSITVFDTFLLLFLINYGIRKIEAFIIVLVFTIGAAFFMEMIFAHPDPTALMHGFIPSLPNEAALYVAISIIGATVMPHNLYLHSSLVQTRKFSHTEKEIKKTIRFNFIDSLMALNMAFLVNCAILILAAATFYKSGHYAVSEIQDAHKLLAPLLGTKWAPALFAIALIAAGQSSTITGTLAGQIVMEGYLNLRIQPWLRRIITRVLAIVPAVLAIVFLGEHVTGKLLIMSQVILSLQLGFAVIPLIHFVSDKKKMGTFAIGLKVKIISWLSALIIVTLNVKLVINQISEWITNSGSHKIWLQLTIVPLALLVAFVLLYITIKPFIVPGTKTFKELFLHDQVQLIEQKTIDNPQKIAVAIDFCPLDLETISNALKQGGKQAEYVLIHVVETAGALLMGAEIEDQESMDDKNNLNLYGQQLVDQGYTVTTQLGFGNPGKVIPQIVKDLQSDLLVIGAQDHNGWKHFFRSSLVNTIRNKVNIPVLTVTEKTGKV